MESAPKRNAAVAAATTAHVKEPEDEVQAEIEGAATLKKISLMVRGSEQVELEALTKKFVESEVARDKQSQEIENLERRPMLFVCSTSTKSRSCWWNSSCCLADS